MSADQNATLTLWLPVGVGISAACLILLAFIILASFLCCFHSTWCIRCPCNRKRGRAQLTVTRLEQPTRRRDNTTVVHVPHGQQTSNGITMFVGPKTTTLLSHVRYLGHVYGRVRVHLEQNIVCRKLSSISLRRSD